MPVTDRCRATPTGARKDSPWSEPSRHPAYRDAVFPSGANPKDLGLDPNLAVRFDLTRDQPDNQILDSRGRVVFRLGSLATERATSRRWSSTATSSATTWGAEFAESIDEKGTGASVFLTENLWGVGSTAPCLHDGRATTLAEAIALHGGEAASSRGRFETLRASDQAAVIAFLDNLVLFKIPEPE